MHDARPASTRQYPPVPASTCPYLPIPVSTCQYLPIPVSTCQYLPESLPILLNTCQYLPVPANACQYLLVPSSTCQNENIAKEPPRNTVIEIPEGEARKLQKTVIHAVLVGIFRNDARGVRRAIDTSAGSYRYSTNLTQIRVYLTNSDPCRRWHYCSLCSKAMLAESGGLSP